MAPTTSSGAAFRRYTTLLGLLNVLLVIAAVALFFAAIIFSGASYLFNDSGHVPETVAPGVHLMFLDSFLCVVLFIWQLKTRKRLFAMLSQARTSMLALGAAYIAFAVLNLFQLPLLSPIPAILGIWWVIVFSRATTRQAFTSTHLTPAPTDVVPPAS